MRKLLLTTVVAAAVVGYAGAASAQTMEKSPATGNTGAAAKTGNTRPAESKGALSGALKGDTKGSSQSAQEAVPSAKPDQKLGQGGSASESKSMSPQGGAAEEEKSSDKTERTGEQKSGATQRGAEEDNTKSGTAQETERSGAETSKGSAGSVKLSATQRSKIESVIGRNSAARVNHVDFDVSVGVKIPRDVHVEVLPTEVVEIVPQFRGYDYIVVGDNILIIDPDSLEIVDIIAA